MSLFACVYAQADRCAVGLMHIKNERGVCCDGAWGRLMSGPSVSLSLWLLSGRQSGSKRRHLSWVRTLCDTSK